MFLQKQELVDEVWQAIDLFKNSLKRLCQRCGYAEAADSRKTDARKFKWTYITRSMKATEKHGEKLEAKIR